MLETEALWALIQIIAIDAMMAADNAIVVGMVAAAVPAENRRKVIVYGTMSAVVMRIAFALVAVQLLKIVGLTLAGGLLLVYVSYDMYREIRRGYGHGESRIAPMKNGIPFLRAVTQIVIADLSMSLDNVLAVAGVANGHLGVLVVGLLVSVVLMAVAANALANIIQRYHFVAWLGLAMVAFVALSMMWRGAHEITGVILAKF